MAKPTPESKPKANRDGQTQLSVWIPDKLSRNLRIVAAVHEMNVRDYVIKALEAQIVASAGLLREAANNVK